MFIALLLGAASLYALADMDGTTGEKEATDYIAANPSVFAATTPTTFTTYTGCDGYLDCK